MSKTTLATNPPSVFSTDTSWYVTALITNGPLSSKPFVRPRRRAFKRVLRQIRNFGCDAYKAGGFVQIEDFPEPVHEEIVNSFGFNCSGTLPGAARCLDVRPQARRTPRPR